MWLIKTFCITGFGKKISKQKGLLKLELKESLEGEVRHLVVSPIELELIVISGEHDITTGALRLLFYNDVSVLILDSFGKPVGYLLSCGKNQLIENHALQSQLGSKISSIIAKQMCNAAITNKISLLSSIKKNTDYNIDSEIEQIKRIAVKIKSVNQVNKLLGFEGIATNEYYAALKKIIPDNLDFTRRTRNPPADPVNALLSYGYGILYSKIRSSLVTAGLSPYYGVLHASYKNQEALVYDFIEEFRQPIVDRVVLTLIARKQIQRKDFENTRKGCIINNNFKKKYAEAILTRLEAQYTHDGVKKSFSEIIDLQAEKLARAILDTGEYKPFIYR